MVMVMVMVKMCGDGHDNDVMKMCSDGVDVW